MISILYLQNIFDDRVERNIQPLSMILEYTACVTSPQFKEYCKTNNGFPLLTF